MTVPSVLLALGLALLTGCSATGPTQLRVSAAASLTDAFEDVAAAFEAATPGVEVTLNLAGSTTLVEQVVRGAPVDVLATADTASMQRAVDGDALAGPPAVFATNRLQLAVPAEAPPRQLAALGDERLFVGLCAATVPCGSAARRVLAAADVTPAPDTEEPDVRALLTKLVAGELDVGLVYATDVATTAGAVRGTDLPAALRPGTELAIGVAADAPSPGVAAEFVAFVLSDDGADVLRRHGFGVPS